VKGDAELRGKELCNWLSCDPPSRALLRLLPLLSPEPADLRRFRGAAFVTSRKGMMIFGTACTLADYIEASESGVVLLQEVQEAPERPE